MGYKNNEKNYTIAHLAPIMGRYIKILKTLKLSFLFNDKKLLLIKICRNVEDDSHLKKRKIR